MCQRRVLGTCNAIMEGGRAGEANDFWWCGALLWISCCLGGGRRCGGEREEQEAGVCLCTLRFVRRVNKFGVFCRNLMHCQITVYTF
jgi:hypothetical protein